MSDDQDIASDVAAYGWCAVTISDTRPMFAYTVGLMFTLAHPELIVFGIDDRYSVLSAVVEDIRRGRPFSAPGVYKDVPGLHVPIATRRVHPSQHEFYLGFAMGYCRERGRPGQLEAVQVFWPDRNGLFPFERGCDEAVWEAQPRLDQQVWPDVLREQRKEWPR